MRNKQEKLIFFKFSFGNSNKSRIFAPALGDEEAKTVKPRWRNR